MENKNLPAFPVELSYMDNGSIRGLQTGNMSGFEIGLTKREYFAAIAMNGLLSQHEPGPYNAAAIEMTCITAVQLSDGLLLELAKPQP